MPLTIMTNNAAISAQRNLSISQADLGTSIGRLSSGLRINKASDDAAGLGISENLKADIRSLLQAQRNANDGVSMSQVAEGAMGQMHEIISRMRELAVQAANGTLGSTERGYIHTELVQLENEVNRIANVTEFNGQKLLDGSASIGLVMQIGIQNTLNDRTSMSVTRLVTSTLGTTTLHVASTSLSTATNARNALAAFDKAIEQLSDARAKLGAFQNRLNTTIANLAAAHENLSAANSRIRDADVASETSSLTRSQILVQAGIAVLGQANQLPAAALSLLQ